MGDPEAGRQHAAEMLALAERRRDRYWVSTALYQLTSLSASQRDWESARDFSDRGLALYPTDYRTLSRRSLLEHETGNFVRGGAYLERLVEVMRLYPPGPTASYMFPAFVVPAVARITGDTGRLEVGEWAARTVLASPSVTHVIATFARFGLGLLAVQRDDGLAAREQYAALEPERSTMLVGSLGATDRLLGLLAQTSGNLDQAVAHFQDALSFCARAGYLPEHAWTCCDYAQALRQRNRPGDRARAISLLDEATHIATELGMRPLLERLKAVSELVESRPGRPPDYPASLTTREVEVLRLVAAGKSSAEIAAALVLSRRTVERHISNIYSKTNTHSRSQATASPSPTD